MENHKTKLTICVKEWWEKTLPEIKERLITIHQENDLINDIIGPRRAGKTYLMLHTIKKLLETTPRTAIIYINFENRKLFPVTPDYLNNIIELIYEEDLLKKHKKIYLFLDEIQKIKNWEQSIRSIYDEFKGKIKIFISGSTSILTKTELGYLLTGRHLTTIVFPLNFKEFLAFKKCEYSLPATEQQKARIQKLLKEYLTTGGFPEIVLTANEELISTLFTDILNRDILPKIKNKEVLEDVAYSLCTNTAKLSSFSKLSAMLKNRGIKISVPTLEKYFWLMKDAFLFFDIPIFSYKAKEQLQYPRKIYCIDNGFVNYFGFKFSEDKGRLMENSTAIRLIQQSLENKKTKVFYWKSREHEEVDFAIKEGLTIIQLIQICCNPDDYDTKKRETKAILKASKELKCNNLLIITEDTETEEKIEGKTIKYIPLWKWLLEEG